MDKLTFAAYSAIVIALSAGARSKAICDTKHNRQYYPEWPESDLFYFSEFMSTFEVVAEALQRIGIMRPFTETLLSVFVCNVDEEESID